MSELPTGTVTFLFTDIEGSTRLLQELGRGDYGALQEQHAAIMRTAIAAGNGAEIRTEGDSFFVVFPTTSGALRAAVDAQRELSSFQWPDGRRISVRMGLHTGEGILGGDDYLGIDVNRAARIAATGHGGQVVLSETTRTLVANALPDGVTIRDLGAHRLKDIEHPEHLHDLVLEGLPSDFPVLRSLQARRTNLPAQRTSFVGRAREIADVSELLDATRLLTVTGPGGIGKTRLAAKVAAERLGRYADGVYFVDLSALTEPAFLIPEIARTLRVRETPGRELAEALQEHLRERELLLVLDNLEQLVEASPVVGSLLDAAPSLTMLVTSRIPLRLSGEQEFRLSSLALPAEAQLADAEQMTTCESVRLFVERAAAVQPGFRITDENVPAVAEIVARLDGLPLALELAASRLRALSLDALASRLGQRLPLLTGGARDAPERQRTLEAAIEWSHELLGPDQRRLFARLSVFAGGWTLEAAETVCGPDLDVLDGLGTLVDDSLVRRDELEGGELRFAMLETIREYATERLESMDERDREAVRRRHAEFVRDLAEEAEPHLIGEDQTNWFATLELEHDNVRAALDRAQQAEATDDVGTGLQTAAAVWRFWQQRGHIAEGRVRLTGLLGLRAAQRRDAARARALGALGGLAYWQTDYGAMQQMYEESCEIARELGDPRLLSWALFNLSFVPMFTSGDLDGSEQLVRESLAAADETDLSLMARSWTGIGFVQGFRGDTQGAIASLEKGIAMLREAGDRMALCEGLIGLAGVALSADDLPAARAYLHEATRIGAESTSPVIVATLVAPHALLANLDGRPHRAARLVGAWVLLQEEYGVHFPQVALDHYGDPAVDARTALGDDDFERARAEGMSMNVEQIVQLITEENPSGSSG